MYKFDINLIDQDYYKEYNDNHIIDKQHKLVFRIFFPYVKDQFEAKFKFHVITEQIKIKISKIVLSRTILKNTSRKAAREEELIGSKKLIQSIINILYLVKIYNERDHLRPPPMVDIIHDKKFHHKKHGKIFGASATVYFRIKKTPETKYDGVEDLVLTLTNPSSIPLNPVFEDHIFRSNKRIKEIELEHLQYEQEIDPRFRSFESLDKEVEHYLKKGLIKDELIIIFSSILIDDLIKYKGGKNNVKNKCENYFLIFIKELFDHLIDWLQKRKIKDPFFDFQYLSASHLIDGWSNSFHAFGTKNEIDGTNESLMEFFEGNYNWNGTYEYTQITNPKIQQKIKKLEKNFLTLCKEHFPGVYKEVLIKLAIINRKKFEVRLQPKGKPGFAIKYINNNSQYLILDYADPENNYNNIRNYFLEIYKECFNPICVIYHGYNNSKTGQFSNFFEQWKPIEDHIKSKKSSKTQWNIYKHGYTNKHRMIFSKLPFSTRVNVVIKGHTVTRFQLCDGSKC